jgi:hypothetical protein
MTQILHNDCTLGEIKSGARRRRTGGRRADAAISGPTVDLFAVHASCAAQPGLHHAGLRARQLHRQTLQMIEGLL